MAVRGCGSGLPGKNDRGLDLYGMLAFIQLQQCSQDRCNAKLNLTSRVLHPAGRTRAATTQTEGLGVITCCRRESEAGLGAGPRGRRRSFTALSARRLERGQA